MDICFQWKGFMTGSQKQTTLKNDILYSQEHKLQLN